MKTERLLNEIGMIDDDIIDEANTDTIKHKSVNHGLLRWVSVAACIVITVIAVVALSQSETPPDSLSELPMLSVSTNMGSYGFEGYMAYDIDELKSGNPWYENASLKILPVFKSPASYDSAGIPGKGLTADEMIQKAKETASLMGLTVDSVYTNPTEDDLQAWRDKERSIPGNEEFEPDATPYEAVAVCGDITIKAEANGYVRIFFEKGVSLPDEYSFTNYGNTEQQAEDATQYLLERYATVVNMASPVLDLFGDYTYYGQRLFSYRAFESSGTLLEKILGYNFNRVEFSPNDEGVLWIIDLHKDDLSQKIGDYPIISASEARKLLLQKHYITTVPEELPDGKYIASVELMYRTDEVFMPYYRFLVELPTMQRDNGLKTFGAFYVPAVESRYLTNMPLWDGSFN